MAHFQPDALTISRGEDWAERRRFAESVLGHRRRRAPSRATASRRSLAEEVGAPCSPTWTRPAASSTGTASRAPARRITRRIVLGDEARDDEELIDRARGDDGRGQLAARRALAAARPVPRADRRLRRRRRGRQRSSSLFAEAPLGERVDPAGQVTALALRHGRHARDQRVSGARARSSPTPTHLALVEDELAAGARRCPHRRAHLPGRLPPGGDAPLADDADARARDRRARPSSAASRSPPGTQILIVNTFMHRDRDRPRRRPLRARGVDRDGGAATTGRFNHFSHGPQGCPGAELALLRRQGAPRRRSCGGGRSTDRERRRSTRAPAAAHARLLLTALRGSPNGPLHQTP